MTYDEVYQRVGSTLVEALCVDIGDITPEATLQGDLGAESIDFLDIVFRLEREFGIKIQRSELFPESIFQGDPAFVQNGLITDMGIQELRVKLPFADLNEFETHRRANQLGDLFTVSMITRYVHGKVCHA